MRTPKFLLVSSAVASWLAIASSALAQPDEDTEVEEDADFELGTDDEGDDGDLNADDSDGEDDSEEDGEEDDAKSAKDDDDVSEDPIRTYYFVGARFRNFIVPKFIFNMFADGGATVNVFTFGPELSIRANELEIDVAVTTPWADYSMDNTMFKSKNDDDTAWERVSSDLKVLFVTIDILKEFPIDDKGHFSFLLGGGVGVGGVFGELRRTQVYPKDPNNIEPDNPDAWNDCQGPGQPGTVDPSVNEPYCDDANDHFPGYTEPSWANGGSKPFIFPYLALPHLAFRWKPIEEMHARLDTGFSMTGFFFGLAAGYNILE